VSRRRAATKAARTPLEPKRLVHGLAAQGAREHPELQPQHKKLIDDSAVAPEVASARGYRSITTKAELQQLGFKPAQCRVPALFIPVRGLDGSVVSYQIRPDHPRLNKAGKIIKYETPKGSSMRLDIPPSALAALGDPRVPLVITEGVRKADSAVSKGICCVALLGVWNWRGTNSKGGKTALPEWEVIALNGREVFIAFDSDVTTKPAVRSAMERLKAFLESRVAKVRIIYFPAGNAGAKVGLDDYLAQGHGVTDLLALASAALPPVIEGDSTGLIVVPEYRVVRDRLVRVQFDEEEGERLVQLANFSCEITTLVVEDDGVETRQQYEILARQSGQSRSVTVPAAEFAALNWVTSSLGPRFVVTAGFGSRDHARAAIQELSPNPKTRTVYTHTGWREVLPDGAERAEWAYLHGGGAIGARGCIPGISVRLPEAISRAVLPAPPSGAPAVLALRCLLGLLRLGLPRIGTALLAAVSRAVLGTVDISLHLSGQTGTFKSEAAALAQRCFGTAFSARSLPGNWSSTGNALEGLAFHAKDMLLVIDDFVPQGGERDVVRVHREADRVLRGQGNNSGRQRMRSDGTLRPPHPPRGLIVSTGEETPSGQSLQSRMVVVEVSTGDISAAELTRCQQDAESGAYALAMSGFVQCVAAKRAGLDEQVRRRALLLRDRFAERAPGMHRRTPDAAAQLLVGFEYLVEYAGFVGALETAECERLLQDAFESVLELVADQREILAASDPVDQFITLLKSAITSGEAHLVGPDGRIPTKVDPRAVGWHELGLDSASVTPVWRPRGSQIGWIFEGQLFLDPSAALRAAQKLADDTGRITLSSRTVGRRLWESGCLVSREEGRGKYTIRRKLQGQRRDVLALRASHLLAEAQSAPSAHQPDAWPENADPGADPRAADARSPERIGPQDRPTGPCQVLPGPIGPEGPLDKREGSHAAEGQGGGLDDEVIP